MELTTAQQTTAFLWAFVLGAGLELIYFMISSFRAAFPPTKMQMFIGDFIYSLLAFVINFIYATAMTEGKIRLYVVIAEIIVFLLLYLTLGRTIKCFMGKKIRRIDIMLRSILAKIGKKLQNKMLNNRQRDKN